MDWYEIRAESELMIPPGFHYVFGNLILCLAQAALAEPVQSSQVSKITGQKEIQDRGE